MKTILELGCAEAHRKYDCLEQTKPVWMQTESGDRKRVHLAGLGDVGRNVALGLVLLGEELIEKIGLYDLSPEQCKRMETELSQIAPPPGGRRIPEVSAVSWEEMFDCDVFLFCATKSVPALDSDVKDVRMAQYEANRKIVALYARQAARVGYRGLFVVVSDPVDLLCMEALRSSAEEEQGEGRRLTPDQIRGCGLGVMNARAAYYAKRHPEFSLYLTEGRAFGPHGKDLVIANSTDPAHYDDNASRALTEMTVKANLEVRRLGFKPFLAPAISSAVLTLLAMLKGEWNYSAAYLNGLYFGALNRQTPQGVQWEEVPLPEALFDRLERSYRGLEEILWNGF
ncbi:MAG: lactate dehydrogenase [Blautia sp.]|nr:lactate dehydrogenase [Blautia sp.]MDY5032583.1 lactate dehydrogenase [Blautia sp.]